MLCWPWVFCQRRLSNLYGKLNDDLLNVILCIYGMHHYVCVVIYCKHRFFIMAILMAIVHVCPCTTCFYYIYINYVKCLNVMIYYSTLSEHVHGIHKFQIQWPNKGWKLKSLTSHHSSTQAQNDMDMDGEMRYNWWKKKIPFDVQIWWMAEI